MLGSAEVAICTARQYDGAMEKRGRSLGRLKSGVAEWNAWLSRKVISMKGKDECLADLSGADLRGKDLDGVDLRHCKLSGAKLREAHLAHARLSNAFLEGAEFISADLHGASLRKAKAMRAVFKDANLRHANLSGAKLAGASFVDCEAFGAGLWSTTGKPKKVRLLISPHKKTDALFQSRHLVVRDLDSAPFLYLLLDNDRITAAITSLNRQVVLILGRFKEPHSQRLDNMKKALRESGSYVPIVFNFPRQKDRSLTETIGTLAHLSHFVIADLTEPRSVPQELSLYRPRLPGHKLPL